MYEYSDPRRRAILLVWADGTMAVDDPKRHNDDSGNPTPLGDYLAYHRTSSDITPGDVPSQVLAHCGFCGKLHECTVKRDDSRSHFDSDDWGHDYYDVRTVDEPARDHRSELVTTVYIRTDGRA